MGSTTAAVALAWVALLLFHIACGAAIARWWAMLLPALVVLIAVPSDRDLDVPFWVDYLLFFMVPAAILVGLGVLAGRLTVWRRRSRLTESLPT